MKSFYDTLKKYDMITHNDSIIAAVSGGADSMAMLSLLFSLKPGLSLRLRAVHVNHGLRGYESDNDELYVKGVCESMDVPLDIVRADIAAEAAALGLCIEEAGRELRYRVFEELRKKYGYSKIAVAHNKNDNAETVLMWLIRGAGLNGLRGIPPVRGHIVRPLIGADRSEIEAYCESNGIKYKTDSSNLNSHYRRNRLRNTLIPMLKSDYNPNIIDTLARTSEALARDNEYIELMASAAYESCVPDKEALRLDISKLAVLNSAVAIRVVRMAASQFYGDACNLYQKHLDSIIGLVHKPSGKAVALPGGLCVSREYNWLVFHESRNRALPAQAHDYSLVPEVPLVVEELGITAVLTREPDFFSGDGLVYTKKFSYDKMIDGCKIRTRRPGDRIYISSMGGNKKLQDYFTDIKLAAGLRDLVPLIAIGSDVIWIIDNRSIASDRFMALEGCNGIYISVKFHDKLGLVSN